MHARTLAVVNCKLLLHATYTADVTDKHTTTTITIRPGVAFFVCCLTHDVALHIYICICSVINSSLKECTHTAERSVKSIFLTAFFYNSLLYLCIFVNLKYD